MEDLSQKHKNELKNLQSEIQRIKKSVPKGDKKRYKEAQITITNLEKEIKNRHEKEINELKTNEEVTLTNLTIESENVPKSQKAKKKKKKADINVEHIIRNYDENSETSERAIETNKIKSYLKEINMKLVEVPADGNCLYNAIGYQCVQLKMLDLSLEFTKSDEIARYLRNLAAKEMEENSEKYSAFIDTEETDFATYCENIRSSRTWGGHLEIKAISSALKRQIDIIQADSAIIHVGDQSEENGVCIENNGAPLIITYHKFAYGLGEHYNTCTELISSQNEDVA